MKRRLTIKKKFLNVHTVIIVCAAFLFVINGYLNNFQNIIEKVYSNGIYKVIVKFLGWVSSIYPYSLGELLFIILILIMIFYILSFLIKFATKGNWKKSLLFLCTYISILYILFLFLWGFNYDRLPLQRILNLNMYVSSNEDLILLCEDLVHEANQLRVTMDENNKGVMTIKGGYESVFERAHEGYDITSERISELSGDYGNPKRIILSKQMSYTGITGIYIPYTGEANININVPDLLLPSTVMHEMAHQRGFASEDEANYISYISCLDHPDADFKYSGVILALIYTTRALESIDPDSFITVEQQFSDGLVRDLNNYNEFWEEYEGNAQKISNKVNNSYLKLNGENDGVESYGKMVDLLLAQYKAVCLETNNIKSVIMY